MTDHSFFNSQPEDGREPLQGFEERFACSRRFVDLTHALQAESNDEAVVDESAEQPAVAHPEIIELIESMLTSNPTLQPGREVPICQRPHAVYVPEHYEAGYAYPLIVWFHGDGASESELARMMPLVSDRNYVGVALRGSITSGSGYGWPSTDTPPTELLEDVRQIVTSLRREYHIHSERIYLAGFGSGATTALQLMLQKPEWFGSVISFSGQMPKTEAPLTRVDELQDKRILLGTSLGSSSVRVGDVVATGRMLYSVGMRVGTRVYQDMGDFPSKKMLRDLDAWLMDEICGSLKV